MSQIIISDVTYGSQDKKNNADQVVLENEEPISPEEFERLRKWNFWLGVLHLATGIIIFIITNKDAVVPSYSFFPIVDSRSRGTNNWVPIPKLLRKDINGYFAAMFLLLAGIDHMFVATVGRTWYEYYLNRNQNPFRWIEYSISASLMHVQVAQLSGVFDVHLIFAIFGLTWTTMMWGGLEWEKVNASLRGRLGDKSFSGFWLACVPHMFGWAIILCYFFYGVSKGSPPAFVWAIIFIIFTLDTTFALNMYVQQLEWRSWKRYYYGEYVFCVLSLVSKQLLAWINFGGSMSLRNNGN